MLENEGKSEKASDIFNLNQFRASLLSSDPTQFNTVSFDFFDTLVFRASLTHYAGWKRISYSFFFNRLVAEVVSRVVARLKGRPEVQMGDIYRFMLPIWTPDMEIVMERENLVPNPYLLQLFNALSAQGRTILVISDTHFDSNTIGEWLRGFGFNDCSVFTSQEFIKTKSTGLFAEIHAARKIAYSEWIHIGDNLRSDIQSATGLGIRALHFPQLFEQFRNLNLLSGRGLKRLSRHHETEFAVSSYLREALCSPDFETEPKSDSFLPYLGLFVGAPISRSIAEEIHAAHMQQDFDQILYSSRDGWLPYCWHRNLYPDDPILYFKTSRAMTLSEHFADYVHGITGDSRKIALFDFGWRGTTLSYLVKKFPQISWNGFFWQVRNADGLKSRSFTSHSSRPLAIWRARDFVELVFTDPSNGYADLNETLEPIERRGSSDTSNRLEILRGSMAGIQQGLSSLNLEQSTFLLELFSRYPSRELATALAEEKHEIREGINDFLVTNSWSRLFSKNRVMWPGSAYLPDSKLMIDQILFRILFHFKELLQRSVNVFNLRSRRSS
jgi:FMN phosphatase YigB (HAD superfamily)